MDVWASKLRDVKDKCTLLRVRVFGIDSLLGHAMFGGQNDVTHGATGWFTAKKKGELGGGFEI